jgi:RHS repeat-associated protein
VKRDSYTGLDYANMRMYSSYGGRFNTPDPFQGVAKGASDVSTPGSWNKYGYTLGDPVNNMDPQGMFLPFCDPYIDGCDNGCDPVDGLPECMYYPWGISLQGGGGGGGGPTMPSAYEMMTLNRAFLNASLMLLTPSCAGLFNVGGASVGPGDLLADLLAGSTDAGVITFGTVPAGAVATATPIVSPDLNPGVLITLDNLRFGGWATETPMQQAGTLLHELGHAYADIFGQQTTLIRNNDNPENPDGTPNPVGAANQAWNKNQINTNCVAPYKY